jgi:uncharacterized protein (TIGR02646 family)
MKYIAKSYPPPTKLDSFLLWAATNKARFSTLKGEEIWDKLTQKKKHKQALQDVIIEEQGYICAYCNRRIHKQKPEDDEQLRMDHLDSKDKHPAKTLDYYNLVGCCYGDQREKTRTTPPRSVHCDVSKDNIELPLAIFPTNISCEEVLIYTSEGEILSNDTLVNEAINKTLNLNCEKLTTARKSKLSPYVNVDIDKDEAEKLVQHYQTFVGDKLEPYCGVLIGYLRQNYI